MVPMRILYLQQLLVLPNCPGNPRSYEFARQWTEAGHEVHFLSSTAGVPADHPVLADPPEGLHFHLIEQPYQQKLSFPKRIVSFLRFFRKALRLGRNLGSFDVILAWSAPLSVGELGRRLAKYHQVPFVFEVADVWPDVPIEMGIIPPGPWRGWLYRRTQKMYAAASKILVFSEGMREQVLRHGVESEKVVVSHNGVQMAKIPFVPRNQEGPTEVIYAGTIGKANGLDQLVRLAKRAQEAGRADIQFTILGSGNDETRVKALAEASHLSNLQFISQLSKEAADQRLQNAHIGFSSFAPYPVLEANSATKFFDYLASGLPVLLNYRGWQADYLERYGCGLASTQKDEEALFQNMLKLVDDPGLRTEMGRKGRQLAEEKFDRKVLAERMMEILAESALGSRLSP
jgi:glycosyltransferase involved in cell wall biosynthesis